MSRSAVIEQFRLLQVICQLLQIFEGDSGCVGVGGCRFVIPKARVEEIFGIGMESNIPIEVALLPGAAGEVVEKWAGGERLEFGAGGISDVPVVFEGNKNARPG